MKIPGVVGKSRPYANTEDLTWKKGVPKKMKGRTACSQEATGFLSPVIPQQLERTQLSQTRSHRL